jgi:hypothetical protein
MGNTTVVLVTFDNETVVGGAAPGALRHKNLGLKAGNSERIGKDLRGGKAALGILAPVAEVGAGSKRLSDLGGTAETHESTDEALEEVQYARRQCSSPSARPSLPVQAGGPQ